MPICPNCGNQAADNAIFCDQCGAKLPAAQPEPVEVPAVEAPVGAVPEGVLICPDCGAENVPGEVFCDVCGNPLEPPEPIAVAGPEVEEVEPEIVEVEAEVEEVEPEVVEAELAAPAAEPGTAYCPTCGAEVSVDDVFCGNCGAELGGPAAVEVIEEEPILEGEETLVEELVVEEEPLEELVIEEGPLEGLVDEEEPLEGLVVEEVVIEEEPLEELTEEELLEQVVEEAPEEVVVEEMVVEEELVEEEMHCPVCGAIVLPEQVFCASCGAAIQVAAVAPVSEPVPVQEPPSVGPYLEVGESGAHIPVIDQDEIMIGREDEISGIHPDIDLTPHGGEDGGVSRRHARLIRRVDQWFIVDLDSTNGTYVNGIELQPKVEASLVDGDGIGLGDVELVFHTD